MSNRIKNQFLALSILAFALLGSFSTVSTADTTARTAPTAPTRAERPADWPTSASATKTMTVERQAAHVGALASAQQSIPKPPRPQDPLPWCVRFPQYCWPPIIFGPFYRGQATQDNVIVQRAIFTPMNVPGSLDTARPLRIGSQTLGGPGGLFKGSIGEGDLFPTTLGARELAGPAVGEHIQGIGGRGSFRLSSSSGTASSARIQWPIRCRFFCRMHQVCEDYEWVGF